VTRGGGPKKKNQPGNENLCRKKMMVRTWAESNGGGAKAATAKTGKETAEKKRMPRPRWGGHKLKKEKHHPSKTFSLPNPSRARLKTKKRKKKTGEKRGVKYR